jgi:DNA polymerase-3 subunit gamma/tau
MSYLVLARKWRPQVFEDVIGQRPITQTLQNAISQKRVAHAFLFTGARGVGKTSTARILAKALNCETGPSINPCNQCKTCHEISSGTSMDVIEIDGASNRGIDEIRELRENVRYTPAKSQYKIFIIDEVHMLTREAFNALLKTLEEPPPHIIFIFATTEPHKIPSTILSRCQRYDFKRIPLKEIVESLKKITEEEKVQISQRGLLYLARESEGSMRDAQSLLDQVISYAGKEIRDEDIVEVLGLVDQKILHDTLEAIADRDAGRCMDVVEQVYLYGYDVQHFCRELLHSLRNLILMKVSQHPGHLIELPEEELQVLRKLAERFPFDHLNHLFNLLLKGEEEVAQSTFPRTMLEMTLIRMATLRPVLAIEDILKKLEGLERTRPPSPASPPSNVQPVDREGPAREKRKEFKEAGPPKEPKEPKEPQRDDAPSSKRTENSADSQDPDHSPGEEPGGESQKAREETWKELVSFTRTRNPVLGAFLAFGNLVQLNEEKIEIGFEKDSFHYERMLETENRSQLEKICRDYLAKETKLVISPIGQRVKSKGRVALDIVKSEENGQGKPLEKGQEGNPLIQETLRLFNGRIVEG